MLTQVALAWQVPESRHSFSSINNNKDDGFRVLKKLFFVCSTYCQTTVAIRSEKHYHSINQVVLLNTLNKRHFSQ